MRYPRRRIALAALTMAALVGCRATHHPSAAAPTTSRPTSSAPATPTSAVASSGSPTPTVAALTTTHAAASTAPVAPPAPATKAAAPAPVSGQSLPLGYSTGSATRVITVVASSTSSTTAVLRAWEKAPGGGWLGHGGALTAHLGSDGLSAHPSETQSATPIGSFALTQAFGHLGNPGTGLPYFQTTDADWWISQSGPLYNTHQHCSSGCSFIQGNPNEHLAHELPYYNYAVVIDYNTAPVAQGAGSAFFLHVTDGNATAGCVAVAQASLVPLMQWLTPSGQSRILIGTA